MRYLALIACLAAPAYADTSAKAQAYALAVGPSAFCGVAVDMVKAGQYVKAQNLDTAEVGALVWQEQTQAAQVPASGKGAYCQKVAGMVKALRLQP